MLQHQPDDQQDPLELRRGDREYAIAFRRAEVGLLDREVVVLRRVITDEQPLVSMDVDQSSGAHIESEEAPDPRHLIELPAATTSFQHPWARRMSSKRRRSLDAINRSRSFLPAADRSILAVLFQWQ